jgi:hypothetical protein
VHFSAAIIATCEFARGAARLLRWAVAEHSPRPDDREAFIRDRVFKTEYRGLCVREMPFSGSFCVTDETRHPERGARCMNQDKLVRARCWPFASATRPDRFDKATASGADVSTINLRDLLGTSDKAEARRTALAHLAPPAPGSCGRALRVNRLETRFSLGDLQALLECQSWLSGLAEDGVGRTPGSGSSH